MNRTPERIEAFCAAIVASGGSVTVACKAIQLSRTAAYVWRADDPEFAKRWAQAKEIGIDVLEDELLRRAHDGIDEPITHLGQITATVKKYSDTLGIFLMKGAKPEKYRENVAMNVTGQIDITAALLEGRKRNAGLPDDSGD